MPPGQTKTVRINPHLVPLVRAVWLVLRHHTRHPRRRSLTWPRRRCCRSGRPSGITSSRSRSVRQYRRSSYSRCPRTATLASTMYGSISCQRSCCSSLSSRWRFPGSRHKRARRISRCIKNGGISPEIVYSSLTHSLTHSLSLSLSLSLSAHRSDALSFSRHMELRQTTAVKASCTKRK